MWQSAIAVGRVRRSADTAVGRAVRAVPYGTDSTAERSAVGRSGAATEWPHMDLAVALATVAAAVRSGRAIVEAWSSVGIECDARGVPLENAMARACMPAAGRRRLQPASAARSAHRVSGRAAGFSLLRPGDELMDVITATRLSCLIGIESGAPISDVLDHAATSVQSYQLATQARRTALAGPRSSVRVLMWLPVATVALGAVLGASPWTVMTDGGIGTLATLAGAMLMMAGRYWVERLVDRAARISRPTETGGHVDRARHAGGRGYEAASSASHRHANVPSLSVVARALVHPDGMAQERLRHLFDDAATVPARPLADELVVTVVLSAIHSGATILRALEISARVLPGAPGTELDRFVNRVNYGMAWDEAAGPTRGIAGQVATALGAAWNHGASAKVTLTRLIEQIRRDRDGFTQRAAARLGVHLVLPLGLCFLPAFIVLGLVPLALSLGM